MRFAYLIVVIAAALGAAACGKTVDTLVATEADSQAARPALVGPTWRLTSLEGRAALAGVSVTATFGNDQRVSGSAGCNQYFGAATPAGDRLTVGVMGSTRMFCGAAGVMDQEQAYFAAMEKVEAYQIVGGELRLGPAPEAVTLVFTLQ